MIRSLSRSAGLLMAAGLSATTALACAPRSAMPPPPTYAAFSAQGIAQPAGARADAPRAERPLAPDEDADTDTRPIYARTEANGDVYISNIDDGAAPRRTTTGAKLYRWRDADGREHISDDKPPAGATVLGTMP